MALALQLVLMLQQFCGATFPGETVLPTNQMHALGEFLKMIAKNLGLPPFMKTSFDLWVAIQQALFLGPNFKPTSDDQLPHFSESDMGARRQPRYPGILKDSPDKREIIEKIDQSLHTIDLLMCACWSLAVSSLLEDVGFILRTIRDLCIVPLHDSSQSDSPSCCETNSPSCCGEADSPASSGDPFM